MTSPTTPAPAWVAIQRNPTSGAGHQYQPIVDLIAELRRQGLKPRLFSNRTSLDALLADRLTPPPVAIAAAGGDGTLLDLLNRHPQLPVATLPLGTENLVAKYLSIPPRDGRFVAKMIARGRMRGIDLGTIGPRRFAIMASCGFDSDVQCSAHTARNGHITRCHYIRPILNSFWRYDFPEVRVYLDDDPQPLYGGMVVVANIPRYACGLPLVPGADPTDGRLDVRIFPHRSRYQLLRDLGNVLLRSSVKGTAASHRATRVRIEADRPLPLQADGDPIGATPVEIGISPQAAILVIP